MNQGGQTNAPWKEAGSHYSASKDSSDPTVTVRSQSEPSLQPVDYAVYRLRYDLLIRSLCFPHIAVLNLPSSNSLVN